MTSRQMLVSFAAAALLCVVAYPCGPDFPSAVFVKRNSPDLPLEKYVAGRLGVVQPGYRIRHLVVAYRWLSGVPLSKREQEEALEVNKDLTASWSETQSAKEESGVAVWVKARAAYGSVDKYVPPKDLDTSRLLPGSQYESFPNCFDDAFETAVRTLNARVQQYGKRDATVAEWVRGQDAVFSNCGDGHPHTYFGPGQAPPPPPAPRMPQSVGSSPLWLQQDRAYQLAAAKFYAGDFDGAAQGFRTIGEDPASGWQVLSRYLVGRTMLRKADLTYSAATQNYQMSAADRSAADQHLHAGYVAARAYFLSLRGDPKMASMSHGIDGMIDFINAHAQPEVQSLVVASRMLHSDDPSFYQDLTDVTVIRINESDGGATSPVIGRKEARAASDRPEAVDLLAWVDAVGASDEATCLERWRKTHKTVWLVAALSFAKPEDAATPELLGAAARVSERDPGWVAVNYHRLRLMPRDEATRVELLSILPRINRDESASTGNLFSALNAATAPDLKSWLSQAGRVPAAELLENDEDNPPGVRYDEQGDPAKKLPKVLSLFTPDGATVLNTRMPLRVLIASAQDKTLAPNLRLQIAQAAWVRAVLLHRPTDARLMTPTLTSLQPAWSSVLLAYDRAKSEEDRKAAGLFAMMRFASTEPNVREGDERYEGFATYSYYRDNWWCYTVAPAKNTEEGNEFMTGAIAHPDTPEPLFLTPENRKEAAVEVATLQKIPKASVYFAQEAFAWQVAHPNDPRTPELLGQAFRVERNACGDKTTSEIAHKLFLALQLKYPTSRWALRYKSWD